MSLNFDLSAVRARLGDERFNVVTTSPDTQDKPADEQKWHPVTDHLIWTSMAVDLGGITEKSVDEWCFRVGLLQKIQGRAALTGEIGDFNLTRKDIVDHIGLTTNVTTRPRNSFLMKIFRVGSIDEAACVLPDEESAADRINRASAEYVARKKA